MSQQSPSYEHIKDVLKSKQNFTALYLQNYVNTKSMSNQKTKSRDGPKMFIQA